ncbi:MAG: AAA family ATPase, partial [Snowella sp.]|nr:AAA family ATPase [Snowella sp.]
YRAIDNILRSPNRLDDLSESQQKQLKERKGKMDLDVRVALTNAYRHLFYPDQDPVKAPTGLRHHVLSAQESGSVSSKGNQQDVIFQALRDCQKIRSDEPLKPYAPAFILQKVWPAGLDHWTTKALREAFAKDLSLKFLIDAEIALLRETIRRGLTDGQWDMKVGEKVYIKTDQELASLPDVIEFSDRLEMYRRGILKPPEPRVIQLSALIISGTDTVKKVRVGWMAKGALAVTLYQDGVAISQTFPPRYEHECEISNAAVFKVIVDYGNGEIEEKETQVAWPKSVKDGSGGYTPTPTPIPVLEIKPPILTFEGTVNKTFTQFKDNCIEKKVQGVESLELTVDSLMDYRKLGTSLSLLNRPQYTLGIDQVLSLNAQGQFVRLEYQGDVRGFSMLFSSLNSLLNSPDAQATINLKLIFTFKETVMPDGSELNGIIQALQRNPVDRLNLSVRVIY